MKERSITFKIGTFNVRTPQSETKKQQLADDITNYRLDVLCLQETKICKGVDYNLKSGRSIAFPSTSRFYGCGFFIANKWIDKIHRVWKVSDRICVLQLNIENTPRSAEEYKKSRSEFMPTLYTITNVYAPTTERRQKYPDEFETFYKDLTKTIKDIGKKTFLLLSGDFNAKGGQFTEGDNSIGKYSKGRRNENGKTLIELCESENLFITNSAFPHPSSHTTTWVGQRRDPHTKKIIPIYNLIDYIICHRRYKHLATNARSYGGTIVTSDHKLVITTFELEWFNSQTFHNRDLGHR